MLNFKHIFVYLAPPFLIFLFRSYCFPPSLDTSSSFKQFHFFRLVQLGMIVITTCAISFGPFWFTSGIPGLYQIFSRLFPFQRGLNHAYWAGNVWAIYSAVDRILLQCQSISVFCHPLGSTKKKLTFAAFFFALDMLSRGGHFNQSAIKSTSRGLIGDTSFAVLPEITPITCFSLTIAFITVSQSPPT